MDVEITDASPDLGPAPGSEEDMGDFASPDAFRGFMSSYFTGVAVVTSVDDDGMPHGLTCNSLASVTLSPPTLLVCLDARSGTLAALRSSSAFAINLLHEHARSTAELFATPRASRFDTVRWCRSSYTGMPRLVGDAYAISECRVAETRTVADHAVVFGHVVEIENGAGSPLLYGRRSYATGFPKWRDFSTGGSTELDEFGAGR